MGFAWGVPGQFGTGNRQRIDLNHVRADDAETLAKALADADLLLLHTRLRCFLRTFHRDSALAIRSCAMGLAGGGRNHVFREALVDNSAGR